MVQQISDAELEIMKIVWGNPEEVTLFPYIMDGQKNAETVISRMDQSLNCHFYLLKYKLQEVRLLTRANFQGE